MGMLCVTSIVSIAVKSECSMYNVVSTDSCVAVAKQHVHSAHNCDSNRPIAQTTLCQGGKLHQIDKTVFKVQGHAVRV